MVPMIDIAALFGRQPAAREAVDRAVMEAASGTGFLVVSGLPAAAHEEIWVDHGGRRRYVVGRPHRDTGFMTLLAQDGVAGLQARGRDGGWIDVPPRDATLAINFGQVLERWTGGRIRATEHRVLGTGRRRHSIPLFYEPRIDAEIAPLPVAGAQPFEPFLFGDHLWATTTRFVEFQGLEHLRPPRRHVTHNPLP